MSSPAPFYYIATRAAAGDDAKVAADIVNGPNDKMIPSALRQRFIDADAAFWKAFCEYGAAASALAKL